MDETEEHSEQLDMYGLLQRLNSKMIEPITTLKAVTKWLMKLGLLSEFSLATQPLFK